MLRKTIFTLLALGAAAPLSAQTGTLISKDGATYGKAIYRMDTGLEIISSPVERSGPETIFKNDVAQSYYYIVPPAGDEWVDEGAFAQRGTLADEEVNGFVFDYCSSEVGTFDAEVRFYTDVNITSGPSAAAACAYGLPGLPGDLLAAGLACWGITVDLAGGVECTLPQELTPGGAETWGWSVVYLDPSNTTGPDMMIQGAGDYGTADTFWDNTNAVGLIIQTPKAVGTFTLDLSGNAMDTRAIYNPTPRSGDILQLVVDGPVKGGNTVTFTAEGASAGTNYFLLASLATNPAFPPLGGGVASQMVSVPLLSGTPVPMALAGTDASVTVNLPAGIPPLVVTQAVGIVGSLNPANVVEASNGLTHE